MSGMTSGTGSVCGWVALDGIRLDTLAEGLVVTDVTEAPSLAAETEPRAGLDGLWLTRLRREHRPKDGDTRAEEEKRTSRPA